MDAAWTDELQLLFGRAAAGDPRACEGLARAWWPRMRGWALAELGDPALAEEACQEALIRLVRTLPALDTARPLEPWLRTVVGRCCRDLARGERRHARPAPAAPGGPSLPAARELDHDLDVRRSADRVHAAMAQLTPRQREALDLVDRNGVDPLEAARRMGVAPATVRVLLHQGRRHLRCLLLGDLHDLVRDR